MNKKQLYWIIPLALIIGFIVGSFWIVTGTIQFLDKYPIMDCVMSMDDMLNVDNNILPFTKESQRKAIEWRCALEHVDMNATYEDIFDYTG